MEHLHDAQHRTPEVMPLYESWWSQPRPEEFDRLALRHTAIHDAHVPPRRRAAALDRRAWSVTLHCLAGCAIGEGLGMVIGTGLAWSGAATIALAVLLAFLFGYALTMRALLASGLFFSAVAHIALAADTASIAVMELVDNLIMLAIPRAVDAQLGDLLFWVALAVGLALAAIAAFPVNRWLIARAGGGHLALYGQH